MTSAAAATASTPPAQSSGPAVGDRLSGTWARASTTTTTASGRLIQNAACQPNESTRNPPTAGPSAVLIALAPAQVPIAAPRSSGGNAAEMMARLCGTIIAAPIPCTSRAAISASTPGASAQPSEASAKTPVPSRNSRSRPKRSPAAPPTRISAPRNSV